MYCYNICKLLHFSKTYITQLKIRTKALTLSAFVRVPTFFYYKIWIKTKLLLSRLVVETIQFFRRPFKDSKKIERLIPILLGITILILTLKGSVFGFMAGISKKLIRS